MTHILWMLFLKTDGLASDKMGLSISGTFVYLFSMSSFILISNKSVAIISLLIVFNLIIFLIYVMIIFLFLLYFDL